MFLDYSTNSRAYKIFNLRTKIIMKSINVVIDNFTCDFNKDEGVYCIDEAESQIQITNVKPDVVTQEYISWSRKYIKMPTEIYKLVKCSFFKSR